MNKKELTTNDLAAAYDKCAHIFFGLLKEIRELSKKKPDATLSNYQVKVINRALRDAQKIFDASDQAEYLDLLDDEDLPRNSDAILVMVQYESALKDFRERHHGHLGGGERGWFLSTS